MKRTTESFIEECKAIYGDKYDYSKVEFKGTHTKVCLICHKKNILGEEHGEFWVMPTKIISRHDGCPKCKGLYKTTEEFIAEAKLVHGDKYNYSKVEYTKSNGKVCIICPIHGEFWQRAKEHLNGQGCSYCKFDKISSIRRDTQETFMQKILEKVGNKYDYSKVIYEKSNKPICVICHEKDEFGEEHGEFYPMPNALLSGHNCPKCSKVYKPTTEEWVEKARKVHGDKYDYSKVIYVNAKTPVTIICHEKDEFGEEHGEFLQIPYAHSTLEQGCPYCDMSHLENNISKLLKENNIDYLYEDNLNGLLKRQRVDFYLPKHDIVIECQGGQHFYGAFNRNNKEKAEEVHQKVLKRDIRKYKILNNSKIKILYYTNINNLPNDIFTNKKYKGIYNENNFFTNKEILLKQITEVN